MDENHKNINSNKAIMILVFKRLIFVDNLLGKLTESSSTLKLLIDIDKTNSEVY